MTEVQALWACLPAPKRVIDEFLREEEHVVYAAIVKSAEPFAPQSLRGDDGLVMPYDYGLAIEPERTEKDYGFYTAIMRGIDGIEMFTAGKYLPCIANHHLPSGQSKP